MNNATNGEEAHSMPNDQPSCDVAELIAAHRYCTNNKSDLQRDRVCGCFYCLRVFNPCEITAWIRDTRETAVCPWCGVDSVIGESSGFPIAAEFLGGMRAYWFGGEA